MKISNATVTTKQNFIEEYHHHRLMKNLYNQNCARLENPKIIKRGVLITAAGSDFFFQKNKPGRRAFIWDIRVANFMTLEKCRFFSQI